MRKYPTIWLVGGFAGKGKDDTGKPGSLLLLARNAAAREHHADVKLFAG
jgi:hypothetical protein